MIKELLENLKSVGDCKHIVIYSNNHYSFFKTLYKALKDEPYKGQNIPCLEVKVKGLTVTVMNEDMRITDIFNIDEDEEEIDWTGI